MKLYGLIGYPLGHSFSRKYFTEKFEKEHLDCRFENFPIERIELLPGVIEQNSALQGLCVTKKKLFHISIRLLKKCKLSKPAILC